MGRRARARHESNSSGDVSIFPASDKRGNSANVANIGACRSQAGCDSNFSRSTPATPGHIVSNMILTFAPWSMALGKRHREAEGPQGEGSLVGQHTHGSLLGWNFVAHEVPPQKRARGGRTTKGIPKQHDPLLGPTTSQWPGFPKQMLIANPQGASAQGICHQPVLGPSFQLGRVVGAADHAQRHTPLDPNRLSMTEG